MRTVLPAQKAFSDSCALACVTHAAAPTTRDRSTAQFWLRIRRTPESSDAIVAAQPGRMEDHGCPASSGPARAITRANARRDEMLRANDGTRTGGEILVDQLLVHGVQHVFCVPGESYLAALDAFYDRPIKLTVCRQEGGATM